MSSDGRLRVLILGLNYAPELVGIAIYTTGLAEELVRCGHDVRVVAGKPYYPTWKVPDRFRGGWKRRTKENGVDLTRVAHYVPARPTGLRRILHHASFAVSCVMPLFIRAIVQRPDVVMTIAPSLIAAPVAWLAARLVGAKAWLHIQDFEVEAAMATDLVGRRGFGATLAHWFESYVLCHFDRVSSISSAMCQKCVEKGVRPERVIEFRNWADACAISPLEEPSRNHEEWHISTPTVALYSGNIGNKQGIEVILAAAHLLKHRNDLTFVVCGEGPNRAALEVEAASLANILFMDLQPKERLFDLLSMATVHLLPQIANATNLVFPSKLANMLASGRPIIATAQEGTLLATEIAGCGIAVPPDNAGAMADAILSLVDDPVRLERMGEQSRIRASENWSKQTILDRLDRELRTLSGRQAIRPDPMHRD